MAAAGCTAYKGCDALHAAPDDANYRPGRLRLALAAGLMLAGPARRIALRPSPLLDAPFMVAVTHLPEDATDVRATLHVVADASPGLLSRLLEPFAKRDLIPDGVEARRDGEMMRVTIRLDAVDAGELHRAVGNIGQVVGVHSVQRGLPALKGLAA